MLVRLMFAAAAVFLASAACAGGEEKLVPTSPTTPPAATATPTTGAAGSPSSAPTVPDDWLIYGDDQGRYTLRYPPGWFKGQLDDFYSNDPSSVLDGGPLPAEVIKVEVIYSTALGSDVCGPILKTNPETGAPLGLLDSVEPASLGGIEGGKLTRTEGDPALEDGLTRIEGIGVVRGQDCVLVVAYYTQKNPDTETVSTIFGSFAFRIAPAE